MAGVNKNIISASTELDDTIGHVSIEGISNQPCFGSHRHPHFDYHAHVYVGETIKYDIVLKRFPNVNTQDWKQLISRVASQATIVPQLTLIPIILSDSPEGTERKAIDSENHNNYTRKSQDNCDKLLCPVLATYSGATSVPSALKPEQDSSLKPYFRDDDTYIIPMTSCLQDISGDCHFVELRVILWLYTVSVTTCEHSEDLDSDKEVEPIVSGTSESVKKKIPVNIKEFFDFDNEDSADEGHGELSMQCSPVRVSSSLRSVQEKSVLAKLKVQGPPELKMKNSSAGQKQLLLLSVSNKTDKQMVIKSIQLLSSSSPVHDVGMCGDDSRSSAKWESCHQLINLEVPKRTHAFPVILCPLEELNLIYKLFLSSIPSDSELSLRANVKWTHSGASHEITTLYKLPRIKIRCPPFIVTVKCDEEVGLGKTFFVTYSISNQLYDFMSMRLYYNLENMCRAVVEHDGSLEEMNRVLQLKDAIVCHDPDIAVSACPRGSCVPIRVGFQIHQPGLYELSELMKVNLRYSLPDPLLSPVPDDRESGTTSSDTSISFQSSDDHLLASEELWRGRSGSTASLATPIMFQTAEERRRSFASKSYSFGDLAPTLSAESDEAGNSKNKVIKRSSAVPPPRPPPPRMLSQTERDLIKPSNFLKQPFYIYVRDPQMI